MYFAFYDKSQFALNVVLFLTWVAAVCSVVVYCSPEQRAKAREAERTWPVWAGRTVCTIDLVVFVGCGFPWTGLATMIGWACRELTFEKTPETKPTA